MFDQNTNQASQDQPVPVLAPTQPVYDYVGTNVQIGSGFGGFVPLAQKGSVIISQGELALLGTDGQLIDKAPLSLVEVKHSIITMGAMAWVRMNGKRYNVSIGHGDYTIGVITPSPSLTLGASSRATAGFVKAFKSLSGKN